MCIRDRQISGKNAVGQRDVAAYITYGTGRANAYKILEDSLLSLIHI